MTLALHNYIWERNKGANSDRENVPFTPICIANWKDKKRLYAPSRVTVTVSAEQADHVTLRVRYPPSHRRVREAVENHGGAYIEDHMSDVARLPFAVADKQPLCDLRNALIAHPQGADPPQYNRRSICPSLSYTLFYLHITLNDYARRHEPREYETMREFFNRMNRSH